MGDACYIFFLKALVHRQNQRWCCIRSLQISSKFWDGLHLMLGRGPGCKNMSRYLILGRGGGCYTFHVRPWGKKNSIITTDPFHIYYKIYYIFRSHGMPLFFLANPCQKIWLSKCHVTRWQKKKKKSKFTCNVLMGMLRDWRGKCFFSQSNSHSRHIRWKKKQESEISIFFPTGRGNESCMQYTVDLILYFLIKIYKINIKSITS